MNERWRKRGRRLLDYLAAAAIASAALLLRKLLPIEPGVGLYPLPLTAIIVSAWLGGRGPGLLATAVSAVGIARWFLPSSESLRHRPEQRHRVRDLRRGGAGRDRVQHGRGRRAERALRESEAYLAETQRLSHTGSWAWAPATGEIRYLSDECRRILDLARDGGPARFEQTFFREIHPEDPAEAAQRVRSAIERRTDFELEYRSLRPDGDTRELYAIGHPVFGPAGEVTEFVGTLVDVTERNRAERERERLRQAQADLERLNRVTTMGELAASLAHEIRQPIAAALTNSRTCVRWLEREPAGPGGGARRRLPVGRRHHAGGGDHHPRAVAVPEGGPAARPRRRQRDRGGDGVGAAGRGPAPRGGDPGRPGRPTSRGSSRTGSSSSRC